MLYVIWAQDADNTGDARQAARPDHIGRLKILLEAGRLVIAGPTPAIDSPDPGVAGMSGSMIVAEFSSLQAAQTWADADPYIAAGVYQKVTVKPYIQAFP